MSKKFEIVGSDLSDGYHTFDELYEHRCLLWIALILYGGHPGHAVLCKDHFEGWDLIACGNILSGGQMSYHVPVKFRHLYEGKIEEKSKELIERVFDGHTSKDVLDRLETWCRAVR